MYMDYELLNAQLINLIEDYKDNKIGVLSNVSSLLYLEMKNVNWVGFYYLKDNYLLLGPFQGKPACMKIEVGKGVCGTSVSKDEAIVVEDVHTFSGHIACDAASNSEIVIPIHKDGKIWGVLDIDSPLTNNFNNFDLVGLNKIVKTIEGII